MTTYCCTVADEAANGTPLLLTYSTAALVGVLANSFKSLAVEGVLDSNAMGML